MNKTQGSWNELYQYRKKLRRRFPNFWRIGVVKKVSNIAIDYLKDNIKALDIGSGNRQIITELKKQFPGATFKSMDIDRSGFHDYYSMDEIKEKFDLVFLFEVIEHLEFDEAVSMLKRIYEILNKNGKIIITTPNIFHPNRYWEYSHKVPYRYDEIGGLLLSLGYHIENIYRVYNNTFLARFMRLYLIAPIHYYFNIDFAESIVVVAGV